jgi:hypothetical protein
VLQKEKKEEERGRKEERKKHKRKEKKSIRLNEIDLFPLVRTSLLYSQISRRQCRKVTGKIKRLSILSSACFFFF